MSGASPEPVGSWFVTALGIFLTVATGIMGFFWRQISQVRTESTEELQRVRDEMLALAKKQDDQWQTAIERIRIDLALANNVTRDERKELKTEMRDDNRSLEEGVHRSVAELKTELASLRTEIMNAVRGRPRAP